MIVIVDERPDVAEAFVALFKREGVCATALSAADFPSWITSVARSDLLAVEAILLGECSDRRRLCRLISSRSRAVIIATTEARSLDETLELFAAGVDDVVRKPIHIREILARIFAVSRRCRDRQDEAMVGAIKVFFDGRDPLIGDAPLNLPRRERRILEYLASNIGHRVSKSQIFNAVYGLFSENIEECVIESHISKLRKRLRQRLGYDPIDSKRFLGYRLSSGDDLDDPLPALKYASLAQDDSRSNSSVLHCSRD